MQVSMPKIGDRVKVIRPLPFDAFHYGLSDGVGYIPIGTTGTVAVIYVQRSGEFKGELSITIDLDWPINGLSENDNEPETEVNLYPEASSKEFRDEEDIYPYLHHNGFVMSVLYQFHYYLEFEDRTIEREMTII